MRDDGKVPRLQPKAIKGRGAASYVPGRFEQRVVHAEDDGWGSVYDRSDASGEGGDLPPRPSTDVREEVARSIISRNTSQDVGFS